MLNELLIFNTSARIFGNDTITEQQLYANMGEMLYEWLKKKQNDSYPNLSDKDRFFKDNTGYIDLFRYFWGQAGIVWGGWQRSERFVNYYTNLKVEEGGKG